MRHLTVSVALLALLLLPTVGGACTSSLLTEAARFRELAASPGALASRLPRLDGPRLSTMLTALAERLEAGTALGKGERLLVTLIRLALDAPAPGSGEEAYRQLAETLRGVEKDYLPEEIVRQWRLETGGGDRAALVEEAFLAYAFASPDLDYDESAHPVAFSKVLKPPARRYARKGAFEGLEVIPQLDHITMIHRTTGAVEIQRIDPALRARLARKEDPLVLAILDDADYFRRLPTNEHLVLYRKPGRTGKGVWETTSPDVVAVPWREVFGNATLDTAQVIGIGVPHLDPGKQQARRDLITRLARGGDVVLAEGIPADQTMRPQESFETDGLREDLHFFGWDNLQLHFPPESLALSLQLAQSAQRIAASNLAAPLRLTLVTALATMVDTSTRLAFQSAELRTSFLTSTLRRKRRDFAGRRIFVVAGPGHFEHPALTAFFATAEGAAIPHLFLSSEPPVTLPF